MHQRGARVLVPQVGEATGEVDATLGQRVGRGCDARQVRVEALVDGIDAAQVMDDALVDRQGRGDHGTVAQHHEVGAAQRTIGTQGAPVGVGEPVLGDGERGGRTGIDLGGHRGEEDVALERRQPEPVDHRAQRAGMAERLLRVALHRVGVHCRRERVGVGPEQPPHPVEVGVQHRLVPRRLRLQRRARPPHRGSHVHLTT